MGSYDFVSADKFGKNGWPFLVPCLRIWRFSGIDLAPWQNVGLATLIGVVESRLRTGTAVQPLWEYSKTVRNPTFYLLVKLDETK